MGCICSSDDSAFQGQGRTVGSSSHDHPPPSDPEERRRLMAKQAKRKMKESRNAGVQPGGGELVHKKKNQPNPNDLPQNAPLRWTSG